MDYWAKPGLDRHQALLFCPTLDDAISADHPVRLLDEILRARDWSAWMEHYDGRRGQPPIPPQVMCGVILYGLMRRIRSSRQLEYACRHNIDFMWLAEGRTIDHDTLCKFRTKFQHPLKDLFKQIGRVAMTLGFIQLLEVAFDGTRVKANASRLRTWTTARIEAVLQELETQVAQLLGEATAADEAEAAVWGAPAADATPATLAELRQRQAQLRAVWQQLADAEAARKKQGIDPQENPAQLPKADLESRVLPNKEGGYAPNYTPTAATDGTAGFLVDCDVISGPNEQNELLPTVDRIEEDFGRKPAAVSADAAFGIGPNLAGMETREVDFYTPVESPLPAADNPARRDDPRQPVPADDWPRLPRNEQKKLDKSCFLYDEAADLYYCPLGHPMRYEETKKYERASGPVALRLYRAAACAGCPLAAECLHPQAKYGRTVTRDGYEPQRARMHAKLQTPEGQQRYHRRMHIGETPFAIIKAIFEVRRFLLRGLEKVRTEWRWVCTAYNLKKLMAAVAGLRAAGKEVTVGVPH